MKFIPLLFSALALGILAASAQPPAAPARATGQMTIRATPKTASADTEDKDGKKTSETVTKSLEIVLSGAKSVTGKFNVVTIFFARDLATKDSVVEKKLENELELDAAKNARLTTEEVSFTVTPAGRKKVDGHDEKVPASGRDYSGWVIRVFQGPVLLGEAASSPPLLKAKTE